MNQTIFADSALSLQSVVQERDLVAPILLVLAQAERHKHGPVSTFQLHTVLRQIIELSDADQEIVRRDNVTRFQRTVQNVISHDLLTGSDFVVREGNGWNITPKGRAHLLDYLFQDIKDLDNQGRIDFDSKTKLVEGIVGFHMLVRLAELQKGNAPAPVSVTKLRKDIKASLPLSMSDLGALKNRSDSKIDQIIRNVISHNSLTKKGYATRSEKGLVITVSGKAHVLDHLLEAFPSPDFGFLLVKENEFRNRVNARRSEVAAEAAANRKKKQKLA